MARAHNAHCLQVCTGVMLYGYPLIKKLCGGLQVRQQGKRAAGGACCISRCRHAHVDAAAPCPSLHSFLAPSPLLIHPLLLSCPAPSPQAFMQQHDFASVEQFRGASLPYFTTHHELVRMQREAVEAKKKARVGLAKDDEWSGDGFVEEAESMVSN